MKIELKIIFDNEDEMPLQKADEIISLSDLLNNIAPTQVTIVESNGTETALRK